MVVERKANPARLVVAIFTMAVFYASVCSTTCSIGFCPNHVQQTAGHDCEQTVSHHSAPSGQIPANPGCSPHQHPGPFLAKAGNLWQFQLSLASHSNVSSATVDAEHELVQNNSSADASELAPANESNSPLYQKISVLRI